MARAIESLVATAGLAIERLQAHANSTRALEAEARERLDALPPPADDDLPGAVKTRATLRVVCRSLRARLRETLRALEGARAAVDAALLAHHRDKTHVPGVAARPPQDGSSEGDVRAFASDVARIVEEAEECLAHLDGRGDGSWVLHLVHHGTLVGLAPGGAEALLADWAAVQAAWEAHIREVPPGPRQHSRPGGSRLRARLQERRPTCQLG